MTNDKKENYTYYDLFIPVKNITKYNSLNKNRVEKISLCIRVIFEHLFSLK